MCSVKLSMHGMRWQRILVPRKSPGHSPWPSCYTAGMQVQSRSCGTHLLHVLALQQHRVTELRRQLRRLLQWCLNLGEQTVAGQVLLWCRTCSNSVCMGQQAFCGSGSA